MTFSIRATIRALLVPECRINCPRRLWKQILTQLGRRGEGRHESGAFLLGRGTGSSLEVKEAIYYDELDSNAYSTGVCVLFGDAFAKLWAICRERGLTVVADAHTHPGAARQSGSDRANPMVARAGHIAIIVPRYAEAPVVISDLGIYEYQGEHRWKNRSGKNANRFLYTGYWS